MDYSKKIDSLRKRYNPENNKLVETRMLSESTIMDSELTKYVRQSMMSVDKDYTQKTYDAGENVKQKLSSSLSNISFEYQGSVMTDTHIKGASDIDLLVLCDKFHGTEIDKVRQKLQQPFWGDNRERQRLLDFNNSFSQYKGNSFQDLASLREDIEKIMVENYQICDITKSKAVKVTNQHLHRDVDIVTSCWFDSFNYVVEGEPQELRGIKIYNKESRIAEGPDYPFLSISRINKRSSETNGRLKRMIRFLKNVRTDSDREIPLHSFEINAICYSIPKWTYVNLEYLDLVSLLWKQMFQMYSNKEYDELRSVVGDEYVFRGDNKKIQAFKDLIDEVYAIKCDLGK